MASKREEEERKRQEAERKRQEAAQKRQEQNASNAAASNASQQKSNPFQQQEQQQQPLQQQADPAKKQQSLQPQQQQPQQQLNQQTKTPLQQQQTQQVSQPQLQPLQQQTQQPQQENPFSNGDFGNAPTRAQQAEQNNPFSLVKGTQDAARDLSREQQWKAYYEKDEQKRQKRLAQEQGRVENMERTERELGVKPMYEAPETHNDQLRSLVKPDKFVKPESMSPEDEKRWNESIRDYSNRGDRAEASKSDLAALMREYDTKNMDQFLKLGSESDWLRDHAERNNASRANVGSKKGYMYTASDKEYRVRELLKNLPDRELREAESELARRRSTAHRGGGFFRGNSSAVQKLNRERREYLISLKEQGMLDENDPVTKARMEGRVPTEKEYLATNKAIWDKQQERQQQEAQRSQRARAEQTREELRKRARESLSSGAPLQNPDIEVPVPDLLPEPEYARLVGEQGLQASALDISDLATPDIAARARALTGEPEPTRVPEGQGQQPQQESTNIGVTPSLVETSVLGGTPTETAQPQQQPQQGQTQQAFNAAINNAPAQGAAAQTGQSQESNRGFNEDSGDFGNVTPADAEKSDYERHITAVNRSRNARLGRAAAQAEQRMRRYSRMTQPQLWQRARSLARKADHFERRGKRNEAALYKREAEMVLGLSQGESPSMALRNQQEQAELDFAKELRQDEREAESHRIRIINSLTEADKNKWIALDRQENYLRSRGRDKAADKKAAAKSKIEQKGNASQTGRKSNKDPEEAAKEQILKNEREAKGYRFEKEDREADKQEVAEKRESDRRKQLEDDFNRRQNAIEAWRTQNQKNQNLIQAYNTIGELSGKQNRTEDEDALLKTVMTFLSNNGYPNPQKITKEQVAKWQDEINKNNVNIGVLTPSLSQARRELFGVQLVD